MPAPSDPDIENQNLDDEQQHVHTNEQDPPPQPPEVVTLPSSTGNIHKSSHVLLYLAALEGDWESAYDILQNNKKEVGASITEFKETALHIASGAKNIEFVQHLMKMMNAEQLRMENIVGNTALCFAAASGVTSIAKAMVDRYEKLKAVEDIDLLFIRGSRGVLPLHMAALLGHEDMVSFLYDKTKDKLNADDCAGLLVACVTSDLYDFAAKVLQKHPNIAIPKDWRTDTSVPQSVKKRHVKPTHEENKTAFHVLARKQQAYKSGNQLSCFESWIYNNLYMDTLDNFLTPENNDTLHHMPKGKMSVKVKVCKFITSRVTYLERIRDQKMMHAKVLQLLKTISCQILSSDNPKNSNVTSNLSPVLFKAAELGIVEFLVVLIRSYPDFFWIVNEVGYTIFHIAVIHRQEKVFSLIHELGSLKDHILLLKDKDGNNMLHLAAIPPPQSRLKVDSGAALQLRKELLWFKEVEKIMQPSYRNMENKKKKTPQSLFTEKHEKLVKDAEEWMKGTSSSCMLVSTLIATVTFAALFTVPGGNNNDSGSPIFRSDIAFLVFAITDSASLIFSAGSILTFLSILTSRCAEQDFDSLLPFRLLIGLIALLFSIASMMVAFGATLFIVLGDGLRWFTITMFVACFLCVMLFAWLHLPLLLDIGSDEYNSDKFFKTPMKLFEKQKKPVK